MKRFVGSLAAAILAFTLSSCGGDSGRGYDPKDSIIADLRRQIATLQEELSRVSHEGNHWFTIALVAIVSAIIGALLALVFGVSLGARAKRDHKQQNGVDERRP